MLCWSALLASRRMLPTRNLACPVFGCAIGRRRFIDPPILGQKPPSR